MTRAKVLQSWNLDLPYVFSWMLSPFRGGKGSVLTTPLTVLVRSSGVRPRSPRIPHSSRRPCCVRSSLRIFSSYSKFDLTSLQPSSGRSAPPPLVPRTSRTTTVDRTPRSEDPSTPSQYSREDDDRFYDVDMNSPQDEKGGRLR